MTDDLVGELAWRSIELDALSEMPLDERISLLAWGRVLQDLNEKNDTIYNLTFLLGNIAGFLGRDSYRGDVADTALEVCGSIMALLGFQLDVVWEMYSPDIVYGEYIHEAASVFEDVSESDTQNSEQNLALLMNGGMLSEMSGIVEQNPDKLGALLPACESVEELRSLMLMVFDSGDS